MMRKSVRREDGSSLRNHTKTAFARILTAVDGSKNAGRAAKIAVKLAEQNAADLTVISVVQKPTYLFGPVSGPVPPIGLSDYYNRATKEAEKYVSEIVSLAKGRDLMAKGRVLKATSSVVRSIADYAEDQEADLVVIGTRGLGGFDRLLLGSVSSGVVAHAPCSVLVVR
jgi:nucleotide-binding universal stress UspA family protein